MRLEFSQQIFEKYPDIKFHENPPSYSVRADRRMGARMDRYDEANSRLSQFCERA